MTVSTLLFTIGTGVSHAAMLWCFYRVSQELFNPLINPAGMTVILIVSCYRSTRGPAFVDETGKLWAAIRKTICRSLILVATGAVAAAVIGGFEGISPLERALLFHPWWAAYLFISFRQPPGRLVTDRSLPGHPHELVRNTYVLCGAVVLAALLALSTTAFL